MLHPGAGSTLTVKRRTPYDQTMTWLIAGAAAGLGLLVGIRAPQSRVRELTLLGLSGVCLGLFVLVLSLSPRDGASVRSLLVALASSLVAASLTLNAVTMVRQWRRRARALATGTTRS